MSRSVPWVPALDHPRGALQAWCGAPVVVATGPGEPPATPCPHCALVYLVEAGGPRFGRPRRRPPVRLDQSDHLDWLALLRVRSGHVSKHGDGYLYRGQPFPPVSLVAAALHGLEQAGLVTLAEPDEDGLAAVAPTEAGRARHAELSQRQRAKPAGDADP